MSSFWQDLRYGLRVLNKNRGFTVVALLTLALGIGANTAIFSVINAVLLRALPYPGSERLVSFYDSIPSLEFPRAGLTEAEYLSLRNENSSFEEIAAWNEDRVSLRGTGEPERVASAVATANLFRLLGAQLVLGRGFNEEEEIKGHSNVVVLSNAFWQRRFAGDNSVIGQSLTLDGETFTVIGVLSPAFKSPPELQADTRIDIWQGYGYDPAEPNRGTHGVNVIALLRKGTSIEQAQAETSTIINRVISDHPEFYPPASEFSTNLQTLHQNIVGDVRPALLVLLSAVTVVLLIVCANVANLLLARGEARQKEIALRAELGASRARIIKQLLIESLLLGTIGGITGLVLARWGLDVLIALSPENIPRLSETTFDLRVVGFSILLSLLTAILFGLAPALKAVKFDLHTMLKEGGRSVGQASRNRFRNGLVVIETALALILLVAAGLLIKSFWHLQRVEMGFNPEHLLTMRLTPPGSSYNNNQQITDLYERLLNRVRTTPGVRAASVTDPLPINGSSQNTVIEIEGRPWDFSSSSMLVVDFRTISSDYFQTMGMRLVQGRFLSEQDREGSLPVAVINETMARTHWPSEEAVGKRFRYLDAPPDKAKSRMVTVVGIVADAKNRALNEEAAQEAFIPITQHEASYGDGGLQQSYNLVVRTTGDPTNLTNTIREEVRSLESAMIIADVRSMEQLMDAAVVQPRFNMILLCIFALLALGLGTIGIYGVISYSVLQRTQEIGVRMALGAQARDVLRMVIRQGLGLALTGVVLGIIGAFVLTRLMEGLLFGVSATDPVTFSAISLLLIFVALMACFIPARRATKVDPIIALKYE
jgi:putative ABC transport system permease protein